MNTQEVMKMLVDCDVDSDELTDAIIQTLNERWYTTTECLRIAQAAIDYVMKSKSGVS